MYKFEYPSISNSNAYAVLALLNGMQGLPFHIAQCVWVVCIVCNERYNQTGIVVGDK